jgi:hypothetical protein
LPFLIEAAVGATGVAAPAQVRFVQGASLVRCTTKTPATAALGHLLPVVGRCSRQLITQKLPNADRQEEANSDLGRT